MTQAPETPSGLWRSSVGGERRSQSPSGEQADRAGKGAGGPFGAASAQGRPSGRAAFRCCGRRGERRGECSQKRLRESMELCQWPPEGAGWEARAGCLRLRLECIEPPEHAEEQGRVYVNRDLVVAVGDEVERPRLEELVHADVRMQLEPSGDVDVVNLRGRGPETKLPQSLLLRGRKALVPLSVSLSGSSR